MANWNFKNLGTIVAVARRCAANTAIPDKLRREFAHAADVASKIQHSDPHEFLVDEALSLFCSIAKKGSLCECKSEWKSIETCPLVRKTMEEGY